MSASARRNPAPRLAKPPLVEETFARVVCWRCRLIVMGARRTLCALALAQLALGTATARADQLEIPVECGSRTAFDAELKKRLGEDAPTSSVRVTITEGSERFHLRVQIGDELRELDDASCRELFRASVVIAVAMLLHDEAKPTPAPSPAPPPSRPSPASRLFPLFGVGAGAGLALGTLPKPVLALELEGKLLWQRLGLSANLRYLFAAEQLDQNQQGAQLYALGAGASGIFRPSRWLEARVGAAAQRLSGRGTNIKSVNSAAVWAAGPTLGLNFVFWEQRLLWASVGGEGQLNLARGHFEILNYSRELTDQPHVVYQVPWLAGAAFVRLGLVW
jgi:hypothetical protein